MPNTGASIVNTIALYPAFSALLINDIVKFLQIVVQRNAELGEVKNVILKYIICIL